MTKTTLGDIWESAQDRYPAPLPPSGSQGMLPLPPVYNPQQVEESYQIARHYCKERHQNPGSEACVDCYWDGAWGAYTRMLKQLSKEM